MMFSTILASRIMTLGAPNWQVLTPFELVQHQFKRAPFGSWGRNSRIGIVHLLIIKLQGSLLIYDHIFVSGNHVSFQIKLLHGPTVWNTFPNQIKMAKFRFPLSQIAQLRWRNVANVGMVAVCTNTLAQRRHGHRRHNYVGATSFSQRCPKARKLCWANVFLPTICQRCLPCWKK